MTVITPSTSVKTTKLAIPQPAEGCNIVGTLEQVAPDQPTQGRKIALVRILLFARFLALNILSEQILHGAMG